ncbi:bifunctional metallophosphatase/5'-nucleotidase [Gulosibacter chungangensis]|uniref:bifunctional metallophosphatase/5'-nucleotidase n=1 Tax=Gulosibacter chungangensis TaxID=979746 RepID=UPI0017878C0D|nr:bifunctional UDP-sugar hydrolase/5'-nucleotidase [Gulosibacter chungangensis]
MAQVSKFVKGAVATSAGCALAFTSLVLPAQAEALNTGEPIQPTADTTQINLLGFNDFHGRITKVDSFASNVLDVQAPFGAENTVIIGNGDQVGASEFESSVALDAPTLEALQELGVDAFTAGNHEFDAGYDTGAANDTLSIQSELGHLLGANVTKADGSLALDAYQIYEVQGFKVAVVGAVTASTPSGVSPDGIQGLTFGNPVDAVNEYAAQLKDGDESNGEADIVVASYHEGGPVSGNPIDNNLSNSTFAEIANDTSDDVDAIFNAHTHKSYNYEYNDRQIVQAGEYGGAVGQIVLTVDADGQVVSSDSSVISSTVPAPTENDANATAPRVDREDLDADSQAIYDTVAETKQAALDEAEILGAVAVGVVNDNISRAKVWPITETSSQDARDQESTLGSVVADSMMVWADANTQLGADLSIMNPGGLRADISGDGELTYKDSQSVLPFVNNLSIVSISGAELKNVLEEQWQLDDKGAVPSRPYLQLGISSNVNYTFTGSITDDPATTQGSHITSVYIDGEPLVDDQIYTVVMPSFLAAGGDNFYSLNNAVEKFDTGSVDLEAFITYVESLEGTELKAEQTRNGFNVVGYFNEDGSAPQLAQGASHTFTVNDVDLHSVDHIANTELVASIDGEEIGTASITGVTANGETTSAEITITIPAALAVGAYTLELTANPSGSTVQVPLEVVEGEQAEPTLATEQEHYTAEETTEGVLYGGENWAQNAAVEIAVTLPDGTVTNIDGVETDEAGTFVDRLVWQTTDEEGNVVEDFLPFPEGTYTITATQSVDGETLTATISFTVGDATGGEDATGDDDANGDSTGGTTPPTDDATGDDNGSTKGDDNGSAKGDDNLAQTGADSNLIFGILAAAAAALALGGTFLAIRRQRNA